MRKVIAVELVSLDSVMERPEEWAFSYSDDEMEEANASGMAASDALLLGRVTYEALAAFWPHQPGGTPMVDYLNPEMRRLPDSVFHCPACRSEVLPFEVRRRHGHGAPRLLAGVADTLPNH